MKTHKNLPILELKNQSDWIEWLQINHKSHGAVWIKFAKKHSGITLINYVEAREGALIWGWIDGLTNAYDENFWLVRFTPRRSKSVWSRINRELVEDLIASNKMEPSGLAHVDAAKEDGRWQVAYESQSRMSVPTDLEREFTKHPEAKSFFESLSKSKKYAFLYRIVTSKKAETRQKHINKTIDMLKNGQVYH